MSIQPTMRKFPRFYAVTGMAFMLTSQSKPPQYHLKQRKPLIGLFQSSKPSGVVALGQVLSLAACVSHEYLKKVNAPTVIPTFCKADL